MAKSPLSAATDEAHLSAGREVFARRGYNGTSVREVVAAADLSAT